MKRYMQNKDILQRKESGSLVIYNSNTGEPFTLNDTAENIWNLLKEPCSIDELLMKIKNNYIDDSKMKEDISDFLKNGIKNGVIDVL